MLGESVSASTVSNISKTLTPPLRSFHRRPIRQTLSGVIFDGRGGALRKTGAGAYAVRSWWGLGNPA